jgi:hypothetical protein
MLRKTVVRLEVRLIVEQGRMASVVGNNVALTDVLGAESVYKTLV